MNGSRVSLMIPTKRGTLTLLVINTLIFLVAFLFSFSPVTENSSLSLGGSYLGGVLKGEVWRLVTANFLQINILHYLFNIVALYYYGNFIESFYGTRKLIIIYVLCGIAGTILSLLYLNSITFGASAAIWGFIGVMVGDSIRSNTYSPGLPIDVKSQIPSILFWLFLGFGMPGISVLGHIGGFIFGIILGLILDTKNTFRPNTTLENIVNVIFYIVSFVTAGSFVFMITNILF